MASAVPYEALVESAASLANMQLIIGLGDANIAAATAFLQQNRVALESARRRLGPCCAVPVRFEESFYSEHSGDFSHLRNLALALRAEAYVAAHDADYSAMAKSGLDILELANAVRRGGLVTDLLVGVAISGVGLETLRKNRGRYDSGTRRLLIEELQRLETEREPFAAIVARDSEWEAAVDWAEQRCDFTSQAVNFPDDCGLSEDEQRELLQLLQQMAGLPETDKQRMRLDQDRHIIALMRLLMIDLALHDRYESAVSIPEHLSELVPNPFPELPLDPFTDASFIYRRIGGASFELYSTGPKMRDGGGQVGPWPRIAAGCADLYLDASDSWPEQGNQR